MRIQYGPMEISDGDISIPLCLHHFPFFLSLSLFDSACVGSSINEMEGRNLKREERYAIPLAIYTYVGS